MKIKTFSEIEVQEVSHNPQIKKYVALSNGEFKNITQLAPAVFPSN